MEFSSVFTIGGINKGEEHERKHRLRPLYDMASPKTLCCYMQRTTWFSDATLYGISGVWTMEVHILAVPGVNREAL